MVPATLLIELIITGIFGFAWIFLLYLSLSHLTIPFVINEVISKLSNWKDWSYTILFFSILIFYTLGTIIDQVGFLLLHYLLKNTRNKIMLKDTGNKGVRHIRAFLYQYGSEAIQRFTRDFIGRLRILRSVIINFLLIFFALLLYNRGIDIFSALFFLFFIICALLYYKTVKIFYETLNKAYFIIKKEQKKPLSRKRQNA